jgi:hypothetical protein
MLKHCAANRKRWLSVLPNVGTYIYTTLKFLALQGASYTCAIIRLRVNILFLNCYLIYVCGDFFCVSVSLIGMLICYLLVSLLVACWWLISQFVVVFCLLTISDASRVD